VDQVSPKVHASTKLSFAQVSKQQSILTSWERQADHSTKAHLSAYSLFRTPPIVHVASTQQHEARFAFVVEVGASTRVYP